MEIGEYQRLAHGTTRIKPHSQHKVVLPLLGLSGEVGELVSEYKKFLRDGTAHELFRNSVEEELGDVLWYLAETATQLDLDLEKVVQRNLDKTRARWNAHSLPPARTFDSTFPKKERFPRKFDARFSTVESSGGKVSTKVLVNGKQMGQKLTDNSYEPDGYRFHDVFHLACVAVLGWSPVSRRNLGVKRRTKKRVDEVEDGGRAIVTEEGISALVFAYAVAHKRLVGVESVDYSLLKAIRFMVSGFEARIITTGEWERAILSGYDVWREVQANHGGLVRLDLDARTITYVRERSLPAKGYRARKGH